MFYIHFIKSHKQSSSDYLLYTKKCMSFNKANSLWQKNTFNENQLRKMRQKSFSFLIQLSHWMKVKITHSGYQNVTFCGLYCHTTFESSFGNYINASQHQSCFRQNHTSRVHSPEYWLDELKWVWSSSDNKSETQSKLIENFVRTGKAVFAWIEVKVT